MNESKLLWLERASNSEFVASVWACSALAATTRPVLADPCISIALVRGRRGLQVILRGPETKPRSERLAPGYTCITIRLRPGVLLQGFPAQEFINSSLKLPVDDDWRFWFEDARLQFPNFTTAEQLIDQLHSLGYLRQGVLSSANAQVAINLSARTQSRLIKRATGLSPYQLHQLERIHQALGLLKAGMPAAAVATELNFVDQSHLAHATKRFLGHTPKQLMRFPQIH